MTTCQAGGGVPALLALHVDEGEVAVLGHPVLLLRLPRGRLVQAQLAPGPRLDGGGGGGGLRLFGPCHLAARPPLVDPQQILQEGLEQV